MDDETRVAFGRIDSYFELNQRQIVDLRQSLQSQIAEVRTNTEELTGEVRSFRSEFRSFRDWTEAGFARVWTELRSLRSVVQGLITRIDRLEERRNDTHV